MGKSAFYEEHKNKLWFMTLRQFLRHKMAVIGMLIMAVIILMVVFVDQIVPYDPETPDLNNMLSPPSLDHPFGTDEPGQYAQKCARSDICPPLDRHYPGFHDFFDRLEYQLHRRRIA